MELAAKLRHMGRQYANGQASRGGDQQNHYIEEAADEIDRLRGLLDEMREASPGGCHFSKWRKRIDDVLPKTPN